MMKSIPALLLVLAAPAFAQSIPALGERPIARTEVEAFVKRQFAQMDANHDGAVTPAEFAAYRARLGPSAPPSGSFGHVGGHWFEKADANGDGKVTLAEAEARPLQLFDMADQDHDGVASVNEQKLAEVMMSLGGK